MKNKTIFMCLDNYGHGGEGSTLDIAYENYLRGSGSTEYRPEDLTFYKAKPIKVESKIIEVTKPKIKES